MTTLQRCLEFLDRSQIRYAHTGHRVAYTALEVAAAEHLPAAKMAKTVVFFGDPAGYGMAVVAADSLVESPDELRAITGSHHIRLATEAEIGKLFETVNWGRSPVRQSFRHACFRGPGARRQPGEWPSARARPAMSFT